MVDRYLSLIEHRANGDLLTLAGWYRKFVAAHPSYKHDSNLTPDMIYDIVETSAAIAAGTVEVPQLLGNLSIVDVYNVTPASAAASASAAAAPAPAPAPAAASAAASASGAGPVPLIGAADRVFDFNDATVCSSLG